MIVIRRIHVSAGVASQMQGLHRPVGTIGQICLCCSWKKGIAYIFITHDLSVVKHISDEICVMYLGQVVEKCATKELFNNTLHPYTQALLSAIPVPSLHNRRKKILLKGELSSPIDPKPGCRFAARCIYATEECHKSTPKLREACPGHFAACHHIGNMGET